MSSAVGGLHISFTSLFCQSSLITPDVSINLTVATYWPYVTMASSWVGSGIKWDKKNSRQTSKKVISHGLKHEEIEFGFDSKTEFCSRSHRNFTISDVNLI